MGKGLRFRVTPERGPGRPLITTNPSRKAAVSHIGAPSFPSGSRQVLAALALALLGSVAVFTGAQRLVQPVMGPRTFGPGATHGGTMPHSQAIEATYGVEFYQVGLSGDGGLVDVRFRVLDASRAAPVLGHQATIKMVVGNERTRSLFDTRAMTPGESNLVAGQSYWVLFRNAGGDITRGDRVDIFVGALHLDGVLVQ